MEEKVIINNRYRICKLLGKGGMGEVYLAEDLFLDHKICAVKSIKAAFLEKNEYSALLNFKHEYEVMTRLKHPNLIRVYDFLQDLTGDYYIVMEYLEGVTLKDYMTQMGNLSILDALDIMIPLFRAVDFIHSRNIIYRDIKPENIMVLLNADGTIKNIKLLDFGLADLGKTENKQIKGSVRYMAPEVLTCQGIDHRADIFSLAILFYEIILGESIYTDSSISSVVTSLSNKFDFDHTQKIILELISDKKLRQLIEKMSAYHKEDRFDSCSEIILTINHYMGKNFEIETKETKEAYILGVNFVSREQELALLTKALQNEHKNLLLIAGKTGIGKSRLIYEFHKYCSLNNITFLYGSSFSALPYEPFVNIMAEIILHLSADELTEYAPFLKIILPDHPRLQDAEKVSTGDAHTEKGILVEQLSKLIVLYAQKHTERLVVYFNNLHNCDELSLEIINELIFKIKSLEDDKILLIGECREEEMSKIEPFTGKLLLNQRLDQLNIPPFNEQETEVYIKNIFGINYLHRSIIENISRIREAVGGNPFFLQEMIRSLVDDGNICKDKSLWILKRSLDQIEIPKSVNTVISLRLDGLKLSDQELEALNWLALIFRKSFSSSHLSNLAKDDFASIDFGKFLNFLAEKEIILFRNGEYFIGNKSISEVITSRISSAEKSRVHQLLADRTEEIYLEELKDSKYFSDEQVEELAFHYTSICQAKETVFDKMISYLTLAAHRATLKYANKKAVNFYDQIQAMIEQYSSSIVQAKADTITLKMLLKRAELQGLLGKVKDSLKDYQAALSIAERVNNLNAQANCLSSIAQVHFVKTEFAEAEKYCKQSIDKFKDLDDQESIGVVLSLLGNICNHKGDFEKSLEYHDQALEIQLKFGNKSKISSCYGCLAYLYLNMQDNEKSMKYCKLQLEIAREGNNQKSQAMVYANMGTIYSRLNDLSMASKCYEKSLQIQEYTNNKFGMNSNLINIGALNCNMGEYKKAIQYYEKALKILEDTRDKVLIAIVYNNLGEPYAKIGRIDRAETCYQKGIELARKTGAKYYFCMILIDACPFYYAQGKYQENSELLNEAETMAIELKNSSGIFTIAVIKALNNFFLDPVEENLKLQKVIEQIDQLLITEKNPESIAWANYLVCKFLSKVNNPAFYPQMQQFKAKALADYTSLNNKTKMITFEERLKELERI